MLISMTIGRRLKARWLLLLALALALSATCQAAWVNNSQGMPFDAIAVRYSQGGDTVNGITVFYLCRAYHNNDVQPGYTSKGDPTCHFGYGGQALTSYIFDYWTPDWVTSTGQAVPNNAIAFGGEPTAGSGGEFRYVCRNGMTPGEYGADLGGCTDAYGGIEQGSTQGFQWLVDPGNNATWARGLAPTHEITYWNPYFGPYQSDDVYAGDYWPPDAIVGGIDSDGSLLYLCTAFDGNGSQPGKMHKDWNACDVGYGGQEHYIGGANNFQVLIPNFTWAEVSNVNDTVECWDDPTVQCWLNPIPVGRDSDGSVLYFCWVYDSQLGTHMWGKTRADWNGCSYAWNGVENWSATFGVLTDGMYYPWAYQPQY